MQLQPSASGINLLARNAKNLQAPAPPKSSLSISPQKTRFRGAGQGRGQQKTSGPSNLFQKLQPQAVREIIFRQEPNSVNSSDESAQLDERLAIGSGGTEQLARPQSYRAQEVENKNGGEEELRIGKEEAAGREPPLFMSPQTAYRKYQKQQHAFQRPQVTFRHQASNSAAVSQELSQPPSAHRSPRAFQPTLKQPGSGRHRKTATGTFDSRAMHYPADEASPPATAFAVQKDDSLSIQKSSAKKPSERQKKRFAEILNLEKLNFQKMPSQASSGRQSRVATKKQTLSERPEDPSPAAAVMPDGPPVPGRPTMQQPSENIPESEQKEQKVNNISLYGSTNPNNLKMTKKRQDFQQQQKAIAAAATNEGEFEARDDSTQSPLGLGAMKSPGGVDWDEDDMMVRSYRLP